MELLLWILGLVVAIVVIIVPNYIVSNIAEHNGKSGVKWFIISLLFTPFFALLAIIADKSTKD